VHMLLRVRVLFLGERGARYAQTFGPSVMQPLSDAKSLIPRAYRREHGSDEERV
jgi:CO/xanthine dehydrogenase Mo-binding subunit